MDKRDSLEDSAAAQFDTARLHKGAGGCPVTGLGATFNPFTPPFLDDPFGFLKQARQDEPVFYSAELDHWVVTKYADVKAVFQNPAIFSAANTLSAVTPMSPAVLQRLREGNFRMNPVLTNLDPPAHHRIRKHTANAFSVKRVGESEPWVRGLVDQFIDRLLAKSPDTDGRRQADMVSEFTYELPAHIAFKFLGVPDEEVPHIKAWTRNRVMLTWGRCDEATQLREVDGLLAMWQFCERHVETLMLGDHQTFLGDLIRYHRQNPDDLTVNEIESILFTMLVAGHETTTNVLSSALVTLLSERKHWERLTREPALIPNAADEMLRHRPSIISWRRIAAQDTELHGHHIPKGGRILLMLASANHDEAHFPDPDTFDPCRANAKENLSFGFGAHFCIGAGLAKLELKVIFEQLTRRLPTLTLDQPQDFHYVPNLSFRGPTAVRVHW